MVGVGPEGVRSALARVAVVNQVGGEGGRLAYARHVSCFVAVESSWHGRLSHA